MKRTFDLSVALFFLIFLSPLIVLISIVVRWRLGSPVFFKQLRPGLNERPFYFYKFRTMTNETDVSGQLLSDAERLTSLGLFLRKFSLDEWLQLVNVLKGDMSLVGPRPLLMEYLPLYSTEQAKRHLVKPGITGWAQINGRNEISWEEKFKFDVWYVENQSFLLDLKILGMTLIKVIRSQGIHHPEHATMEPFRGVKQG
ncbi:sugar transferase [Pullulanibacillus sp. KACC 23026]|uniref:sugar transferase n=1 Tax=Pullulanibacillus sp. KACC 23026 TaxID=3028315 RepID=UPI0023B147F2|nr:sugar transferase [Pullulanibacillus sp. KACC 23026]WEG11514.1 sugar transferase [Pullulanibacillus sp. KACC 23026]